MKIKSLILLFISIMVSEAHAVIGETSLVGRNQNTVLNLEDKHVDDNGEFTTNSVGPQDKVYIINEEPSAVARQQLTYVLLVMPADGSEPYRARYNTSKNAPLSVKVTPPGKSDLRTLKLPDNQSTFLVKEMEGGALLTQRIYHQDEMVSLGIVELSLGESNTTQKYHRVLVRQNISSGEASYGYVPVEGVTEQDYTYRANKAEYNWDPYDLVSSDEKNPIYYETEDGETKKLGKGEMFQYHSDVDGGRKGHIVRMTRGTGNNSSRVYQIVESDVVLPERLIPFQDLKREKSGATAEDIRQKRLIEEAKKMNQMLTEIEKSGDKPVACPAPVLVKPNIPAKESELTKLIKCAVKSRTGITKRSINDVYIENLAPRIEKFLKSPYGPTGEAEKLHFIAQLLHETGGFKTMIEGLSNKCWRQLDSLASAGRNAEMCAQFTKCSTADNEYFKTPRVNSKGVTLNYTHKDTYRGRFPIQITHCYNYLGFFRHLDLIEKGNKAEAMKHVTNFSSDAGRVGSYCSEADIKSVIRRNKDKVNLDPLNLLTKKDVTSSLSSIASPCETKIGNKSSFDVMAQSALWYWKSNPNCKNAIDKLSMSDSTVVHATKCINGGTNGQQDRKDYFNALKSCRGK
jgi:predicted chitinase